MSIVPNISPDTPKEILPLVEKLVSDFDTQKVYLYNLRRSPEGELLSFKLAAVVKTGDKEQTEVKAYRVLDSDVPFEILVYTPKEWEKITSRELSFASRVIRQGVKLYG